MREDCCSGLLREIFLLMDEEHQALLAENEEKAYACLELRNSLLAEVWKNRETCDPLELRDTLAVVQAKQEELSKCAEELLENLRDSLKIRKKQSGYFSQSRYQDQQSQKSTCLTLRS